MQSLYELWYSWREDERLDWSQERQKDKKRGTLLMQFLYELWYRWKGWSQERQKDERAGLFYYTLSTRITIRYLINGAYLSLCNVEEFSTSCRMHDFPDSNDDGHVEVGVRHVDDAHTPSWQVAWKKQRYVNTQYISQSLSNKDQWLLWLVQK